LNIASANQTTEQEFITGSSIVFDLFLFDASKLKRENMYISGSTRMLSPAQPLAYFAKLGAELIFPWRARLCFCA
jgi:hypothetical protein